LKLGNVTSGEMIIDKESFGKIEAWKPGYQESLEKELFAN
jgi:hypothetical protein